MKIAVITPWNHAGGSSVHAELLCREWITEGHTVKIFSYKKYFEQIFQYQEDEPYVQRIIWVEPLGKSLWINEGVSFIHNPEVFLEEKFDILVIEKFSLLPKSQFFPIFQKIKSKKVWVVHEVELPLNPFWYKFEFDSVICLTEGMKAKLSKIINPRRLRVIHYPCYKVSLGDKVEARVKLDLPLDKKIFFSFGWRLAYSPHEYLELLSILEKLARKYSFLLLLISKFISYPILKRLSSIPHEIRLKTLTFDEIYLYLQASDLLLLPRSKNPHEVVSSQACLCLGAGCPIFAPDVKYFQYFKDEIIKYKNKKDCEAKLVKILEDEYSFRSNKIKAIEYASKNSCTEVAKRYIELFEELLQRNSYEVYLINNPIFVALKRLPFLKFKYYKEIFLAIWNYIKEALFHSNTFKKKLYFSKIKKRWVN